MRAAVLTKLNEPLELFDQIEIPALGNGQAQVKIAYSGVCQSQVMEARGARGEDRWLPHMLGHEATGTVVDVGAGVTKVKPGDKVILGWIKGSGIEAGGTCYECNGMQINAGGVTTFSDQAIVSENRLTHLPDGVGMDVGVLFGCALPTGAGLVLNELSPKPNTTIAIFGLGGIGLCALMATRLHGFAKVVAIDIDSAKLELAKRLGADETINAGVADPVETVKAMTEGGADYAIEASGHTRVIEQAFASTHPARGLTLFASHPRLGEMIKLDPHHLISGRQIRGSWGGGSDPDRDVAIFAQAYRDGVLKLDELVGDVYPLSKINNALDDLEAGRVLRPIIDMSIHE